MGKGEAWLCGHGSGFCPPTEEQAKPLGPGFPVRLVVPLVFRRGVPPRCGDAGGWQGRRELGEADGDGPRWWEQGPSRLHFLGLWVFLLAGTGSSGLCSRGGAQDGACAPVGCGRRAGPMTGCTLLLHFPGDTINNVQAHQKWKVPLFLRDIAPCAACTPLPAPPSPSRPHTHARRRPSDRGEAGSFSKAFS